MIRTVEDSNQRSGIDTVTVVQNWHEELKRLVPVD